MIFLSTLYIKLSLTQCSCDGIRKVIRCQLEQVMVIIGISLIVII